MWTNNSIVQTLVWLAIFAFPLQYVPSITCGCNGTVSGYQSNADCETGCCPCTGASFCRCGDNGCCTATSIDDSCCSDGLESSGCQCGSNCQCGSPKQPIEPVAPPVENTNPVEKLAVDSLSSVSIADSCPQKAVRQHSKEAKYLDAKSMTSLSRCVTLCRFAL